MIEFLIILAISLVGGFVVTGLAWLVLWAVGIFCREK